MNDVDTRCVESVGTGVPDEQVEKEIAEYLDDMTDVGQHMCAAMASTIMEIVRARFSP